MMEQEFEPEVSAATDTEDMASYTIDEIEDWQVGDGKEEDGYCEDCQEALAGHEVIAVYKGSVWRYHRECVEILDDDGRDVTA